MDDKLLYIIELTDHFPNFCIEKTKDFGGNKTRYFQVGPDIRMTVILYEDELPYFLFQKKGGEPVDRMAYLTIAQRCHIIFPDIPMPYRANQWYNEETGVLHARPAYGKGIDAEWGA